MGNASKDVKMSTEERDVIYGKEGSLVGVDEWMVTWYYHCICIFVWVRHARIDLIKQGGTQDLAYSFIVLQEHPMPADSYSFPDSSPPIISSERLAISYFK